MKIHIDLGELFKKAAPFVVPIIVGVATQKATELGDKLLAKAAKPKA